MTQRTLTGSLLVGQRLLDFDALREKEDDERKGMAVALVAGEAVVPVIFGGSESMRRENQYQLIPRGS